MLCSRRTKAPKLPFHDPLFAVRAAYQVPIKVNVQGAIRPETAYPYTFEDALAFENLEFFGELDGNGLVKKFRDAIKDEADIPTIGEKLFEALKQGRRLSLPWT